MCSPGPLRACACACLFACARELNFKWDQVQMIRRTSIHCVGYVPGVE